MSEQFPAGLAYHYEHTWAQVDGRIATFGITWYAQENLNEIVFVDLPAVGDHVTKDEPYAEIESLKAVSDVYAPLSGTVVEANHGLTAAEGTINQDPYGRGWLVKVQISDPEQIGQLLRAHDYREMVGR